ncbi:MAG: acyl-ACP--UDP-N-acetylglucosamine O-acyltransferase [Kiritimatiellaeota bacterium]|nr:acyl-ACP--UDP-N-acetylglucosamine O-acyltransferase [Kiritimatiellota bacterium]
MARIHQTAVVDGAAEIAENVEIGPFCVIGPDVVIGEGCKLVSHCSVIGHTTLGENNTMFPFVSLGTAPQDREFEGRVSYLRIGSGNIFREGFTANCGTMPETETVIGNDCFCMTNSHVGHNSKVGDRVVLVNDALLGGYTEVGDNALLAGLTAVHQFCRVGTLAMIGGCCAISKDLPPFMTCFSRHNTVSGLNLVGMKRSGMNLATIRIVKELYRLFYRSGLNVSHALERIAAELEPIPEVSEFTEFVKNSKRGVLPGKQDHRHQFD